MVLYILEHGLPLDEVMFYDTGMEFEAIYRIRDKLLPILAARDIRYTELSPPVPFLYDILDRVSCWCCSNKNRRELKNIFTYLPDYWERLKAIQARLDRPMKAYQNKRDGCYGRVEQLEKVFEQEAKFEKVGKNHG